MSFGFLQDMDILKAANLLNDFFSEICCSLPPLDPSKLPHFPHVPTTLPQIENYDIYDKLSKVNIKKSCAPFDPPPRIIKKFALELTEPLTNIINASFRSKIVPNLWKQGYITPLPKTNKPESCNDLRPITITSIFARIAEKFAATWIKEDTQAQIDPHQYGNRAKTSTSHYLLYLMDYIYRTTDAPGENVALLSIDFSKAFDRVNHNIAVKHLLNNGMRPELAGWVTSFLSNRSQAVRFNGTISDMRLITCGVPQGTVLGPLIFNNHINSAGKTEQMQCKYVDDLTIACKYNKNNLPVTQIQANRLSEWSTLNDMEINGNKSKLMLIDFSKNKVQVNDISIQDETVPQVNEICLLGLTISNNLQWKQNSQKIVVKASKRLFAVKKLKTFKASQPELVTYFTSFIRPILEYASSVWCTSITQKESIAIERVQKRFCRIVLGQQYVCYNDALKQLSLEKLEDRRITCFRKDSIKLFNDPEHRSILPDNCKTNSTMNLRHSVKLQPIRYKTDRYKKVLSLR